jgi:Tol biopolymer transport system component
LDLPFPAYKGDQPYIFVSYAHQDSADVYPDITWLHQRGFNVWYDEGIPPGEVWREELARAIEDCAAALYFVSPRSVTSENCLKEVNFALENRHPVIAVHLETTEMSAGLRMSLGDRQGVLRYQYRENAYREKLAGTLSPLVSRSPTRLDTAPSTPRTDSVTRRPWLLFTLALVAVTAVLTYVFIGNEPSTKIDKTSLPVQLTAFPPARSLTDAAISPDGKYLAFISSRKVFLQTIATREAHEVQLEWSGHPTQVAWSADGSRLYLLGGMRGLWSVSQFGGKPRLIDEAARKAAVSPDGKHIAMIRTDELGRSRAQVWVMASDGTNQRQLLTPKDDDSYWQIAWTPDSKRVAVGIWSTAASTAVRTRIDTVALDGTDRTTLLESEELFQNWTGVLPFAWCGDGRLVYARRDGPTHQVTSNVWITETNAVHKALEADPMRLTQWVASNVRALNVDMNCSRIVAMRATNQLDVFVAEFTTVGLSNLRQVTFDERQDHPADWNSDADKLLLQSSRSGSWDLFEQSLERELPPEPWLSAPGEQTKPDYALGDDWIVYLEGGEDPAAGSIYRAPRQGGVPVEVIAGRYDHVECAAEGNDCVAGVDRGAEYVFTAFHVLTGVSRELARTEHRQPFTKWDLSPDGTRIAVVHNDNNEVKVIDLESGEERSVIVRGWQWFEFITWAADGLGFVVNARPDGESFGPGTGAGLIYVNLTGKATLLRRRPNEWDVHPVMSPDGRRLAFSTMKFHANAWLIENP